MSSNKGGDLVNYINSNQGTLTGSNYNEMDALVFSELSYMKFECIVPSGDISVAKYAELILKHGVPNDDSQNDRIALLNSLISNKRYSECKIPTKYLASNNNNNTQWAAMTIKIDNNTSVISMRGTDGTLQGWIEDFALADSIDGTKAQKLSKKYIEEYAQNNSGNILLTGHSKGGNNVIAGYVMNSKSVRDRVKHIDNFDGPGLNPEFIALNNLDKGYNELKGKLTSYYPENSIFGQLLNDPPGEAVFFKADAKDRMEKYGVLGEHDRYAWQITTDRNSFEKGEYLKRGKQSIRSVVDELLLDALAMLLLKYSLGINTLKALRMIYDKIKKELGEMESTAYASSDSSVQNTDKKKIFAISQKGDRAAIINVNTNRAKVDCNTVMSIGKSLDIVQQTVNNVMENLSVEDDASTVLKNKLKTINKNLEKESVRLKSLGKAGIECMRLYTSTEQAIARIK